MHKFYFFLIISSVISACNQGAREKSGSVNNEIRNEDVVKGEELFKMHCITCHTPGYIDMQPAFPRKTWEKITDKMIKSFGAPIPDSSAVLIVDYLMSVKGIKE